MNKFDQFKMETRRAFRTLEGRIAALESGHTSKRKRQKAPRPSSADTAARQGLWGRYTVIYRYFHPRRKEATAIKFCTDYLVGMHPSEFSKWLAGIIVVGGCVDLRIRRALEAEIRKLELRAGKTSEASSVSHGNLTDSQQNPPHPH